ncbi:putative entry exclusion protein TrbK-alt [Bradyrhizobium murdochi]|uniref:putative entry exclusion protein TrbK-alt n=1 Tax=Bradyrhizobium murdochi TaxID=1038859 RepID=UPI001F3A8966|nr:putative entry exclusion protein TrbK-alt [Bradyrhizobium murdochi]
MKNRFERLPIAVAVGLAVLSVAACAIRLRGDESATQSSASLAPKADATAAKLEQCRTVTYEQKEALLECQKIWAQRGQFLGGSGSPSRGVGTAPFSSPVPRKDESRVQPGHPSIPSQNE